MARQIEDITVKLGIQGFEELNKLRSSFRELTKVTNATDAQLDDARKRLLELKTELGNTARVNKGLTDAFGALLDEAKRGSDVWKQLNTDLAKVRQEARLTDTQITALRDIIINESKAHTQSANSIREHVKSLQDLRNQASLNGKVHQQLGADIQRLTATLEQGEVANKKHYSSLGQILAVKPDAVLNQWRAYTRILQEGTASADKLATAQRRLNQLSGAPRILERRRISESAAITQDPEYLKRFGFEGRSLPELPNTNAAYAQQIKELQQDLIHLDRTSIEYLQTLMQLAGVQRQSTEVARGYAQALLMGVQTKTVANDARNLQEVITALRVEMQQLDTTTSEGSATYAANANQVRSLEQQLNKLASAYRHVGDMATQAATAEQNAANKRIRENYLNRGLVRQQEAALAELGQRVRQGVSGTPLLLPAAGQTSAPGTGLAVSGGASVRLGAMATAGGQRRSVTDVGGNIPVMGVAPGFGVQRFFGAADLGAAPAYQPIGPQMTTRQEGENRTQRLTEAAQAYDTLGRSAERARRPLRDIYTDITKATSASNGSLSSLRKQADLWGELRNVVNPAAPAYKKAGEELDRLNSRIERLERSRRKLTGMQLAQGVGAALSGGIFGGPEGLIGGLGGLAVGGVGGAFAGAAFGAQVGMLRQSAYSAGEYAASVDRLNIALQGVVKSTDAYAAAQQTIRSAQVQLNLPILEGTQGFTQLSASVIAAGGNVTDASTVFRGVTEAIKATGGGAEQVQAALLAMSQIFSKGKVSAEELQGQLGERLPGAVALFAAATNRSLPQLQKDLQDGVVGLNDVMKFASKLSETYGTQAAAMAASSADSTARMQASLKDLQYSFGSIVKPISSSVQDVISKMADMANATLKAVGVVKTGLSELGAVDRAKDLSRRAGYAYTALGVGPQSYSEKKTAFALAEQLANAATPQRSAVGVKQNIAALQQALEVIKRIDKQELSNKQIDLLFKYGTALDKRVEKERTLLRVLESKVKVTTFKGVGQDSSTKEQTAADKAAKEAQAAAVEQQRLATDLREQQLRVADTVFQHQIELDRQRYELQKRLDDAQAQNRILRETGISRTIVTNFENLQRSLREIEERRVSAQQRVAAAEQIQRTAAARASFAAEGAMRLGAGVTSRGLPSGISGYITGDPRSPFYRADHGGSNYHEHLSFISRAAAEAAYKTLTGAGIKVTEFKGYGRVGRHSEGSAHYRGLAFDVPAAQVAVGAERALTARVQALLGFGVGRLPKGAASQQSRALKTAGAASIEALDTAQARRELLLTEQTAQKEREQAFASFVLNATDSLREQNAALEESNKLQALRNRLSLEGVSPERINLEERLLSLRIQQGKSEETYTKLKAQYPESASQLTDAYQAQTVALQEQVRLLRESADAQESYNKATRGRQDMRVGKGIREGAQAYVDSLGTMREATSQLAQTGIKGVEDALFSLVTTGTANFREFAASILKDTARMIIQQMILRQVMQIFSPISSSSTAANFEMPGAAFIPQGGFKLNAMGAAYAANGIQPFARGGAFSHGVTAYAMGGVVKRPTMFAFANGGAGRLGLMGEAGPEAIMPLRRLPSGRLGVESAGGGGMNVIVNVDASGSQVQGNSADASQLGKVLSAAVQQELINQQRPGGLLAPKR